jgi:hypothetical protein
MDFRDVAEIMQFTRSALLKSFTILHHEEGVLLQLKERDPEWEYYQAYKKVDPNYWCHYCKIRKSKKNENKERLEYCLLCESQARRAGLSVAEFHGRRLERARAMFEEYVKGKEMVIS